MNARVRRIIGLALAAVLVVGIVVVVFAGQLFGSTDGTRSSSSGTTGDLTIVNGVIGSEKKPFFEDPDVRAVFAEAGLDVRVVTAGSRQIATSVDLSEFDFAFPASAPAAEKIKREAGASTVYAPFFSPMAVATFAPIATLLQSAGVASVDAAGTWHLNMAAYLDLAASGTRWNELPGAAATYNSSRSVLISSTDIRQSNSAAMYLSISSYVANGDTVVNTPEQEAAIIDPIASLFLAQGFSASSSEAPFEDYLAQGIGSKPLVMIYEAQFLGRQMSDSGANAITDDMLLMYPDPTVLSKHTVVPLGDTGSRVGELLQNDPRLAALAAQYGFRPADPSVFAATLTERGIPVPVNPVNVVEPPSYETLESMIENIGGRYDASQPAPTSDESAPPKQ